jgi:CubicO group peptidase (beta-lactamase class C family)
MKKIISIILIGLLIGCSFSVQGIFFDKTSEETTTSGLSYFFFDKKMELFMKLAKYPSLSACIIEGDEVTWSKAYGHYDLGTLKPAMENTIYNIASISKTITGTALMQLWEQGLFDLDEDVNNYLPFSLRNPHFPDDPITFRMLLSHSSSLNYASNEYFWFNFSGDPPFSFFPYPWLEEFLVPGGRWYHPNCWSNIYRPGDVHMYANVGFDLIEYLVELISGEDFLTYCKDHIFIPLEMYHTSFNFSELNIDNIAIPYLFYNGEYHQINELEDFLGRYTPSEKYWRIRCYAAGGLYTTTSDLSHFFIAHINDGIWNGVRILEKETVKEMHTIQSPETIDSLTGYYYGLAWLLQDQVGFNVTLSGHTGGNYGVISIMLYFPDEKSGVIYFTNGGIEQNSVVASIAESLIIINLFKLSGINILSYIDFGNI